MDVMVTSGISSPHRISVQGKKPDLPFVHADSEGIVTPALDAEQHDDASWFFIPTLRPLSDPSRAEAFRQNDFARLMK